MPSRKLDNNRIEATERQWSKDMDAYKRLKQDGLQPAQIDGAANIEKKADHPSQVVTGIL